MKRDDDRTPVGGAVNMTDLTTPISLMVDPVTLRLLVNVHISSNNASVIPVEVGHDQNRKTTGYGAVNNGNINTANEKLGPLLIDHTNGYLFVDILV